MSEIKRYEFGDYSHYEHPQGLYCLYSEVETLLKQRDYQNAELIDERNAAEARASEMKAERDRLKKVAADWNAQLQQKDEEIERLKKEKYIYEDWQLDTEPPHKINGKFIELKHYHELNNSLTSYRELMGRMVNELKHQRNYCDEYGEIRIDELLKSHENLNQ